MKFQNNITFITETSAISFKPQSFIEEISNYYFNKSVDTLIRNENDMLLEVRVGEYARSDYDSIDFEYVEELEQLITEAKKNASILKIRCE